jgi:transposase-like protein
VDKAGQTVDFFLSRNRDVNAAKTFLRNAIKNRRTPTKITLDAFHEFSCRGARHNGAPSMPAPMTNEHSSRSMLSPP